MNNILLMHILWSYRCYIFLGVVTSRGNVYHLSIANLVQMFSVLLLVRIYCHEWMLRTGYTASAYNRN